MKHKVSEKFEQVAVTRLWPIRIHVIIWTLIHHSKFHKYPQEASIFSLFAEFIHDFVILYMQILNLQHPFPKNILNFHHYNIVPAVLFLIFTAIKGSRNP